MGRGMVDQAKAADHEAVPKIAIILGALGLIPFILGTFFEFAGGPGWGSPALRYYAATILAFMGGIHWGLAIGASEDQRDEDRLRLQLIASVIPSLIAWLALLMPVTQGLTVMALAFLLLFAGDLMAVKRGWAPAWYPRLRMPLTAVVTLCLLAAAWV